MKKFLTLVLGLIMITACSSDDKGSSTVDGAKITKKWYFSTTKIGGQTIPYTDHEDCGKDYVEFLSSGVFREVDVMDCELIIDAGTWNLDGKNLTIFFSDGPKDFVVSKLTATVLEVTYQEDYDDNGVLETVITTFTDK